MKQQKKDNLIEFNRNNILDIAKTLFQKNGVEKTTMDDIAKKADYSKSTIYVYFKSKEEIFNTIVHEYFLILKDGFTKISYEPISFRDKYYKVCNMFLDFKIKYPLYFEMLSSNISINEKDLKKNKVLKNIYDVGEEINLIIKNILEDGIKEGVVREDIKILETTFILHASIFGMITIAYNKKEYFKLSTGLTIEEFLQSGFELLLLSIIKK